MSVATKYINYVAEPKSEYNTKKLRFSGPPVRAPGAGNGGTGGEGDAPPLPLIGDPLPPLGVHYGISFEQYKQIPAVNASSLKLLAESAKKYRRAQQKPDKDSKSLILGQAAHTAIFEPDLFPKQYACWTGGDKRKARKESDAWKVGNADKKKLDEKDYDACIEMRDAVRSHELASKLLTEGHSEVTVIWVHPRTGLICKSRLDWPGGSCLVDLKTTRHATAGRFIADVFNLGYHIQLAFYSDALATQGVILSVKIIAVQNCEPFDVAVYNMPEEVLQIGRDQYENALDRLIECQAKNEWPGIAPDKEITIHAPYWATGDDPAEQLTLTMGGESIEVQ